MPRSQTPRNINVEFFKEDVSTQEKIESPRLDRVKTLAFTLNQIDSCTEGYDNPMDNALHNPNFVAKDLNKMHNNEGHNAMPTLENIEDYYIQQCGLLENEEKRGILEEIILKLITTGRFKFTKMSRDFNWEQLHCKKTKLVAKMQKVAIAVVTCRRLKVVAKQASVRMEAARKAGIPFNAFLINEGYAESIKIEPLGLGKNILFKDHFFEKYVRNESPT